MDHKMIKKLYYFVLIIIMTFLLVNALELDYGFPNNMRIIDYYIEHGIQDTGAVNLVASIYLDYRAYDTLMETIVLFMAVTGVMLFLGKGK